MIVAIDFDGTIVRGQFPAIDGLTPDSKQYIKMLKADEPKAEIAKQFLRWDKAGGKPLAGLTRRRNAEAELFLKQD